MHYYVIPGIKREMGALFKPRKFIGKERILATVANYFNVTVDEIKSPIRKSDLVYARHVAVYMLRTHSCLSQDQIAEEVGRADHSSAWHSIDKVQGWMKVDERVLFQINEITEIL